MCFNKYILRLDYLVVSLAFLLLIPLLILILFHEPGNVDFPKIFIACYCAELLALRYCMDSFCIRCCFNFSKFLYCSHLDTCDKSLVSNDESENLVRQKRDAYIFY